MSTQLVNLCFYKFMKLDSLPALRAQLKAFCLGLELKGTILIANEGLNAGLSGTPASIEAFKQFARKTWGADEPAFKETRVPFHSYKRMLVKIKKEIIPVGDPTLDPNQLTGKRLAAADLKKWLDEGRPMVLVDTRNKYEIEVGTFEKALDLGLDHSRGFAEKVNPLIDEWKDKTVVTFCTGGIRCEKASAYLVKQGLNEVYQLEGGILRYLEETHGAHFRGECFVFDWRLALDSNLDQTARSDNPDAEFGRHLR